MHPIISNDSNLPIHPKVTQRIIHWSNVHQQKPMTFNSTICAWQWTTQPHYLIT
jgi:hypothetical protein